MEVEDARKMLAVENACRRGRGQECSAPSSPYSRSQRDHIGGRTYEADLTPSAYFQLNQSMLWMSEAAFHL